MDEEDEEYIHNRKLLSHKKEWNNAICSSIKESRDYHTKQNQKEKDKCHIAIYYHLHVESKMNNI